MKTILLTALAVLSLAACGEEETNYQSISTHRDITWDDFETGYRVDFAIASIDHCTALIEINSKYEHAFLGKPDVYFPYPSEYTVTYPKKTVMITNGFNAKSYPTIKCKYNWKNLNVNYVLTSFTVDGEERLE